MPRSREKEIGVGQDSFLDVVSNIVGILIVLVVLVGSQVKEGAVSAGNEECKTENAEREPETPNPELAAQRVQELEDVTAALEDTLRKEQEVHAQIRELEFQAQRLDAETKAAATDRMEMATTLSVIRQQMEAMTTEEDVKKRELMELHRQAIQHEQEAEQLRQRLVHYKKQLEGEDGGPMKIQHKMTPITRTVETEEVWFMMQDGRIAYIPLSDLQRNYDRRLQNATAAFLSGQPRTDVVGPMDGFTLHCQAQMTRGSIYARWVLETPPMSQVGETPQAALAEVSKFRNILEHLDPGKHVLTIWVYPSAFAELQDIKREMYREGFSIAIRPLPEGAPISASPDGQRSVAQ